MFRIRILSVSAAIVCLLTLQARAAEVDCRSVYCFGTQDFSQEQDLRGIFITAVPEDTSGTLLMGSRTLRAGDLLTAQQISQMTFVPADTQQDRAVFLEYLPIYEQSVAPCAEMTLSILGKEDKAPVAEDFALETYKNLEITGNLKVSDPEKQALQFTVIRQPRRGSITIAEDGSFCYTPKKNKVGVDSFTYTAADPAGNVSREATVTVTILKPTDSTVYTDTVGRDCRFSAEWMRQSGIFAGEQLGEQACFQPDKTVSRGEFVTMLVKALDVPTDEQLTYTGYSDQIPQWLSPYLAAAVRSGLTADLQDPHVFGTNEPITGTEARNMLRSALALGTGTLDGGESTVLSELGLESDDPLTREQAAQVLYRASSLTVQSETDTLV